MHQNSLKKTNKPVIVVVTHGAPVPSPAYSEVDAVISAGYTGQGHKITITKKMVVISLSILQRLVMQC